MHFQMNLFLFIFTEILYFCMSPTSLYTLQTFNLFLQYFICVKYAVLLLFFVSLFVSLTDSFILESKMIKTI